MIFVSFCICLFLGLLTYINLFKSRKLFSDRFGMIVASVMSSMLGMAFSFFCYYFIASNLLDSAFFSILIGTIIGMGFGGLVKYHTLIVGWFNGVVGSLMGLMLGAVIKDPSLCSLPAAFSNNVYENTLFFSIFISFLTLITCGLINYAYRI